RQEYPSTPSQGGGPNLSSSNLPVWEGRAAPCLLLINRDSGLFHLVPEIVLVLLVRMCLNRIIPRVDVPLAPVVTCHIPRGAQKYAPCVHDLAEGYISQQHAHKENVNIKDRTDSRWYCRMKSDQSHCQLLHAQKIDFPNVPHQKS